MKLWLMPAMCNLLQENRARDIQRLAMLNIKNNENTHTKAPTNEGEEQNPSNTTAQARAEYLRAHGHKANRSPAPSL